MRPRAELLQFLANHARELARILDRERQSDTRELEPEPDPEPPEVKRKAGPRPGTQEWFRELPPPRNDGITMNALARRVPRPRPPRRPSGSW